MPYDSNGNFGLVPGYFVQNGDNVLPSQHNPPFEDVSSGLNAVLLRNGVAPWSGNANANGNKLINLAEPTNPNDAARLTDIQNQVKTRFMANKNGVTQSWPGASTSIIVTFAEEVEDEGGIYDPATSRFTPKNGKKYFVYGQYRLNNTGTASDNSIECRLLKNGSDIVAAGESERQTVFNTGTATVSFMVTGNGTDYYQIQAFSQRSFTDTINGDVNRTYFMAFEI